MYPGWDRRVPYTDRARASIEEARASVEEARASTMRPRINNISLSPDSTLFGQKHGKQLKTTKTTKLSFLVFFPQIWPESVKKKY